LENENRINLLFLLPNFDTGGSEKLVVDLAENLDRRRFNPVICAFFGGIYEERIKRKNIPFYEIHDGRRQKKHQIVATLNRIVQEQRIDLVNSHHTMTLLQGLPSFKLFNRIPVIHTEHTKLSYDEVILEKYIRMERFFLKFVDVALGISQGVCAYYRNELRVSDKKIVKILNGIDINKFRFSDRDSIREGKRKELGLDAGIVAIGLCANFRKQKNHPLLLKAVKNLKERSLEFKVILCGVGPEEENVRALARDLAVEDKVMFLGPRLDIPELMQAFDIYCLPSFFEGLPFSLMEAAAAGLPAVATNVDGNNEVVIHERTGLLVESDHEEALTNALARMIQEASLRERMRQEAIHAAETFSFQTMMKQYDALFTKWARKRAAR
jgi:glycosyltransferase involved in cell wall biosynthesis